MMTEQAKKAFYEWERNQYGEDTPLNDEARELWCEGFKEGVMHLFESFAKSGGNLT